MGKNVELARAAMVLVAESDRAMVGSLDVLVTTSGAATYCCVPFASSVYVVTFRVRSPT
jgi:hypothetical protein